MPLIEHLPPWVEDRIRELGEWSIDNQMTTWKRIATVAELLEAFPEQKARKEVMALVSDAARIKSATQRVYARLWTVVKSGAAEGVIQIPQNIDATTARVIVEHGGGYDVIALADRDSWTLKQARAWAMGRTVEKTDKPLTVWRYLTKQTDKALRKRTEPLTDSEAYETTQTFRRLLLEFGKDG